MGKKSLVVRFFKFGLVGSIGFGISFLILNLQMLFFSNPFYIRLVAPLISAEIALLSNYAFYHHWVWTDRKKESRKEYWMGFLQYNVGMALTTLLSIGLMNLLVEWFRYIDLWKIAAPYFSGIWSDPMKFYVNFGMAIDIPLIAILNFFFTDKLVFKKEKACKEE